MMRNDDETAAAAFDLKAGLTKPMPYRREQQKVSYQEQTVCE